MSASGGASGLVVKLDNIAPATLPVNSSAAIFCLGSCFHRYEVVRDVEIIVDGVRHRPTAFRMPRADVVGCLRQGARSPGGSERSSLSGLEARGYRSGFWATIPVQTPARSGALELKLAACLATGSELISSLGRIEIVESEPTAALPRAAPSLPDGLIAICMATFEPDMNLFRVQLDSLRSQTDPRWLCVISDDCSSPRHFEEIKRAVGEDRRFVLSRSNIRLGFYRNFERALKMVPAEAELVAMCDQDDRWHPEKLEVLRSALGRARLVYSDQRLVDSEGRVLRATLWKGRRNNYRNLASQLVANTITGAATLFRRELLDVALPFPGAPGILFHDHWLGLAAMASGEVTFVDRPLYDYVQHTGAILGHLTGDERSSPSSSAWRGRLGLERGQGRMRRWHAAYFYGYLTREVQAQTLLVRCSSTLTARKRRVLRRFVRSGRAPLPFAWLALRPLRAVVGCNETLGSEADLVRGIIWRWLIVLLARWEQTSRPGAV